MKITVAKHAGYCFGVKNAIEIAKNNSKDGIYTLGELIHNERVVKSLIKQNIKPIDNPFLVKKNDKVIIRAHGVAPDIERTLKENGAIVIDATCPFVKKLQKTVKEYSEKGYKILIIGEATHPEVQGVLGYANGNAEVININSKIDLSDSDKYCVVSQTTALQENYEKIVKNIENCNTIANKIVVFFNTICYTTKARQSEALELSKINDIVLVLGSKSSSNANRLFDIANTNAKAAYFIENLSDLKSVPNIFNINTMAILAAASTPQELIEEVLNYMSDTQSKVLDTPVAEEKVVEKASAVTAADEKNPASEEKKIDAPKAKKELTMEDIVASDKAVGFTNYREGKRIKAKVINADENGIFVEIGGKKDGFIDKTEVNIDGSYNPEDYKNGDNLDTVIIKKKGDATYVNLSKRDIDFMKRNDEVAEKKFASDEFSIEPPLRLVKNKAGNPAGLEGRIGRFTIFIPGSQIKRGRVRSIEDYTNKKLRLRVLSRSGRRITASQRVILEEEHAAKEDAFWESMQPDTVVKGKVKRFANFGAFIGVKGHDCLAHISDLSWNKIKEPGDVLEIGKTYEFLVLKADREAGKISLGYKQLQKKPYEIAAEKYPVGTVIKGKVARIHSFGAFVQIDECVDGLIHVSQISHKYVKDASDVLKEGDEVEAKIIKFEGNRITLSMKELMSAPEKDNRANDFNMEDDFKPSKPKMQRNTRAKKFEYNPNKFEERKPRRNERKSDEPRQWVSDSGVATLADLLTDIDFNFDDDESDKTENVKETEKAEKKEKKETKKAEKKATKSTTAKKAEKVEKEAKTEKKTTKKVTEKESDSEEKEADKE